MCTTNLDLAQVTADFKKAMRSLASTVTIISTAEANGTRHGMAATAVSSLAMDPPSLLACINQSASIHAPLSVRGRFCVNVLHIEHEQLVQAFSGGLKGEARFGVGRWRADSNGIPYLEGALSNLFCDVDSAVPFGTHSIVIGRITAVRSDQGLGALVYADGKFGAMQPMCA